MNPLSHYTLFLGFCKSFPEFLDKTVRAFYNRKNEDAKRRKERGKKMKLTGEDKKIYRKFRIVSLSALAVYLLGFLGLSFALLTADSPDRYALIPYWFFLFDYTLLGLFCLRFLLISLSRSLIRKVLFEELNAKRLMNVMNAGWLIPKDTLLRMRVSYFSGDVSTAVTLAHQIIEAAKKPISRYKKHAGFAYLFLLQCDLEHGDLDRLRADLRSAEESPLPIVRHPRIVSGFKTFRFFLNGETDAFIKDNTPPHPNGAVVPFIGVQSRFQTAVAYFFADRKEESRVLFERLRTETPNMIYSSLSDAYLRAIDEGTAPVFPAVNRESDMALRQFRSLQTRRVISNVFLVLAFAALFVAYRMIPDVGSFDSETEAVMDEAIRAEYEADVPFDCFILSEGKESIDLYCLVKTDGGRLDIGVFAEDGHGNTLFLPLREDLRINESYTDENLTSGVDYRIEYRLLTESALAPDGAFGLYRLQLGQSTYFLCITRFELAKTPADA